MKSLSQEFRLKNIVGIRNYFIEKIRMNWWVGSIKNLVEFSFTLNTYWF